MSKMDGPPYSRAAVIAVARELCETLAPLCVRIALAGSLRRGKQAVGDVELLYISRVTERPADLFSSEVVALADLEIDKHP
jgi:DNA polymerase/3'-5' exonuclease PolX